MIFTIDDNHPAIVRFIPVHPVSLAVHHLKNGVYSCTAFGSKVNTCTVCDMRHNLYQDADDAESEKAKREANEFARVLRPIERHYLAIVERTHPEKGVQILAASKWLYQIILKGWVEHPCPPPEPTRWQLWTRLKHWWTRYKRPASALHEKDGVDFIIRREMKGAGGRCFASFETSTYATTRSPLGTPAQITDWKLQAEEALKTITIPPTSTLAAT